MESIACCTLFARVKKVLPLCDSQSVNGSGDSSSSYRVTKAQSTPSWETPALQKQLGEDHRAQDPWVLEAIQGYRISFSQQPYQPYPPRALTHSQAEEVLMQQEIQSVLEKHAIEKTTPRGHVSCQLSS